MSINGVEQLMRLIGGGPNNSEQLMQKLACACPRLLLSRPPRLRKEGDANHVVCKVYMLMQSLYHCAFCVQMCEQKGGTLNYQNNTTNIISHLSSDLSQWSAADRSELSDLVEPYFFVFCSCFVEAGPRSFRFAPSSARVRAMGRQGWPVEHSGSCAFAANLCCRQLLMTTSLKLENHEWRGWFPTEQLTINN